MKKLLYIFLLFLVLPFACFTQTDTTITNVTNPIVVEKQQPTFKNQIDLDVQFLGVSLGYKHRLYNNWFVGGKVGGGFIFTPSILGGLGFDIFSSQILLQYAIKENTFIGTGPKYSIFWVEDGSNKIVEATIVVYIGLNNNLQLGIGFGFFQKILNDPNFGTAPTTSLTIRIPLKKW